MYFMSKLNPRVQVKYMSFKVASNLKATALEGR